MRIILTSRPDSHPYRVKNTTAAQIQKVLLTMGTWLPETCEEFEINILRSCIHRRNYSDRTHLRCYPVRAWMGLRCLEGVRECDGYAV